MTTPPANEHDDLARLLGLIITVPRFVDRLVESRAEAEAALREYGFAVTPERLDALAQFRAEDLHRVARAFGPPGFIVN